MIRGRTRTPPSGPDPRRAPSGWLGAGGGRGFVRRPTDLVRAGAGLAVLVACGALVRAHTLSAADSPAGPSTYPVPGGVPVAEGPK